MEVQLRYKRQKSNRSAKGGDKGNEGRQQIMAKNSEK